MAWGACATAFCVLSSITQVYHPGETDCKHITTQHSRNGKYVADTCGIGQLKLHTVRRQTVSMTCPDPYTAACTSACTGQCTSAVFLACSSAYTSSMCRHPYL
eukprot:scaffold55350_cov27-Tisochrysis_lutea.AAC.1